MGELQVRTTLTLCCIQYTFSEPLYSDLLWTVILVNTRKKCKKMTGTILVGVPLGKGRRWDEGEEYLAFKDYGNVSFLNHEGVRWHLLHYYFIFLMHISQILFCI